jgi:hypothetical protein
VAIAIRLSRQREHPDSLAIGSDGETQQSHYLVSI